MGERLFDGFIHDLFQPRFIRVAELLVKPADHLLGALRARGEPCVLVTLAQVAGSVRQITARETDAVVTLLAQDPVAHCFVASRVAHAGADQWRLGGDLLGYFNGSGLASLVYVGANLVPVATTPQARAAFADRLRPRGRRCSSLVGPAEEVLDLWRLLEPAWGPAREVRSCQPLMVIDHDPWLPPDPRGYGTHQQLGLPPCTMKMLLYSVSMRSRIISGESGSGFSST